MPYRREYERRGGYRRERPQYVWLTGVKAAADSNIKWYTDQGNALNEGTTQDTNELPFLDSRVVIERTRGVCFANAGLGSLLIGDCGNGAPFVRLQCFGATDEKRPMEFDNRSKRKIDCSDWGTLLSRLSTVSVVGTLSAVSLSLSILIRKA